MTGASLSLNNLLMVHIIQVTSAFRNGRLRPSLHNSWGNNQSHFLETKTKTWTWGNVQLQLPQKQWTVLIAREGTNICPGNPDHIHVPHEYEKFLIQDNLYGKEESNSACIQKEHLPNTNNNRDENTKMSENALQSIKDPHGRKLDIFAQLHLP